MSRLQQIAVAAWFGIALLALAYAFSPFTVVKDGTAFACDGVIKSIIAPGGSTDEWCGGFPANRVFTGVIFSVFSLIAGGISYVILADDRDAGAEP